MEGVWLKRVPGAQARGADLTHHMNFRSRQTEDTLNFRGKMTTREREIMPVFSMPALGTGDGMGWDRGDPGGPSLFCPI